MTGVGVCARTRERRRGVLKVLSEKRSMRLLSSPVCSYFSGKKIQNYYHPPPAEAPDRAGKLCNMQPRKTPRKPLEAPRTRLGGKGGDTYPRRREKRVWGILEGKLGHGWIDTSASATLAHLSTLGNPRQPTERPLFPRARFPDSVATLATHAPTKNPRFPTPKPSFFP